VTAPGAIGGTNTGDVTLAGTPNYLTLVAQVLTRALIDLASHVTGRLPFANLFAATAASRVLVRGSGSGGGDWQEGTLGPGLSLTGTVLSATATAPALDDVTDVTLATPAAGQVLGFNGSVWENQDLPLPTGGSGPASYLTSGGQVAWVSAYTFDVSAATYVIGGVVYASAADSVTLSAAHATLDRIDVIAVDTSGNVVVIEGTAAAQPSEPDVDPTTQLKLGFVLVEAASAAPTITTVSLYAENTGGPGEWNWTTSGSGFNVNSTNNPRTGTKDIEGTTVANNAYAQGEIAAGSIDPSTIDRLVFYIRSKGAWNSGRVLRVQWFSAGVAKGTALTIASGYWGFDSSNTTNYQLISIPMPQFAIASGITANQLRITDSGGSIGFYIDDIALQTGGTTGSTVTGITQEQADARYRQLSDPFGGGDFVGPASSVDGEVVLFDSTTGKLGKRATGTGFVRATSGVYSAAKLKRVVGGIIGDGTNVISTGAQSGCVTCPVAGTITKVRLLSSDAAITSGSIVIDIWRDTYTNYPPTVADTITAAAKPTISSGTKYEDAVLTGWSTAVAAGDIFRFNVDSVTSLKMVTIELTIEE
jgi:hypothetical protein